MPRVGFLTTRLAAGYVTDDDLVLPHLRDRGIDAEFLRWREPADWAAFDLVVVRSTWDYQRDLEAFLATLAAIHAATRLENPLDLQRWNIRKTYLRDLEAAGVPVVPTAWRPGLEPGALESLFDAADADELVIKPVVGSSGEDAWRLRRTDARARERELLRLFRRRPLMAQPFLPAVLDRGETSVVWMDGAVSHALRKTPRPGEFRSQEEHGGRVEPVRPDAALLDAAARVAAVVDARAGGAPLYGRVDFLPGPDGWLVGELELVEPSLYLRVDPEAPARFAEAVARRVTPGDSLHP